MNPFVANASTACFPGYSHEGAVKKIVGGIDEPALGELGAAYVQLCPQNATLLCEERLEAMCLEYPGTLFRLHANVPLCGFGRPVFDASSDREESRPYFAALARLVNRLWNKVYTLHAGRRARCSREHMADNVRALSDLFGARVGVEGLYPAKGEPWLISTWDDYAWLLESGLDYAVDLSHLNILAAHSRRRDLSLVRELLSSEHCVEVHLSNNNGRADSHEMTVERPWWWDELDAMHVRSRSCVIFSEGNHLRMARKGTGSQQCHEAKKWRGRTDGQYAIS